MHGDSARVTLVGEIDLFTVAAFGNALELLAQHGVDHFELDVTQVTFMDSNGVDAIFDLLDRHPRSVVSMTGASPIVRRLAEVTGLDRHVLSAVRDAFIEPRG